MPHTVNLFMWAYQTHFRASLEFLAKHLFEQLGVEIQPRVLLVGVRRPGSTSPHPVCIEPEEREWDLFLFDGLTDQVEKAIPQHPLQRMHYGDQRTMREKPERIRKLAISEEVQRSLQAEDRKSGWRSFCSIPCQVEDYDVVCVIQVPEHLFSQYPLVELSWRDEIYRSNLIDACIHLLLKEAQGGLAVPEPGRHLLDDGMRSAEEIIRRAASNFMRSPFIAGSFCRCNLFEAVNRLSQLRYEGRTGLGRIVLAAADDPNVEFVVRLAEPVQLTEPRWARKLLQMAEGRTALIADYETISGLGRVSDVSAPPYSIEFLDYHQWDLRRGDQVLLRCRFGEVRLPQEPIGKDRFIDNMQRVFPAIGEPAVARFKIVLDLLSQLSHGSSLVIAADASDEAKRLARQGTVIVPTPLTKELLERATAIDGSVLADPAGVCHAIGVILDGHASEESTPSRGARYNSAVRYVTGAPVPRMAFVISEDRTLDVVPLLRPRVERSRIEAAVAALLTATLDDYHEPRLFLDNHRFYLDAAQCRVINGALDRIEAEPREVGRIMIITPRFSPHPAFEPSYLVN